MIVQCKGKDVDKVAKSKLLEDGWFSSIKYDGNYVQIEKRGNIVKFWTSGGKQFYIEHIADELVNLNPDVDFTLEAEYIANTSGKLGSRGKCTTTTYRTNFAKGLSSGAVPGRDIFKVFDCIYFEKHDYWKKMTDFSSKFTVRQVMLQMVNLGTHCEKVEVYSKASLSACKKAAKMLINDGYEGLFCIQANHVYEPSKRLNTAIKIKGRKTADLLCIDTLDGEGKYSDMIGSLVLQDSKGRIVNVGSGLDDYNRAKLPSSFIGKIIEIEYEQILDTYIQPTFTTVREDKTVKDMN